MADRGFGRTQTWMLARTGYPDELEEFLMAWGKL
jgi:hypothetical protein